MRNPDHLKPHLVYTTIGSVPFDKLKSAGFKHIIFDKDNTLTNHDLSDVRSDLVPVLDNTISLFGSENVWVFSNNRKATISHGVSMLNHSHYLKKPLCGSQLLTDLRIDGSRTVIVGDRLMTDMCLAHTIGGLGVYVKPWDLETEQSKIRVSRLVENVVWSKLMKHELKVHDNDAIRELAKTAVF